MSHLCETMRVKNWLEFSNFMNYVNPYLLLMYYAFNEDNMSNKQMCKSLFLVGQRFDRYKRFVFNLKSMIRHR